MRHWRRNADPRLRELERAAAAGDPAAVQALLAYRVRTEAGGDLLRWLGSAEVRDLQALVPPGALDGIANRTIMAVSTRPMGNHSGWFPDHHQNDVCPRGHRLGDPGVRFYYRETIPIWRVVDEADDEGVVIRGGIDDTGDSHVEWLECGVCMAAWDQTGELDWS